MGQEDQAVQEGQVIQAIPWVQVNHLHPDQEGNLHSEHKTILQNLHRSTTYSVLGAANHWSLKTSDW